MATWTTFASTDYFADYDSFNHSDPNITGRLATATPIRSGGTLASLTPLIPQTTPAPFMLAGFTFAELHQIMASLELQRIAVTSFLMALVCYISLINLVAIITLAYGVVAPTNSLAIRMVCLRKKPLRLSMVTGVHVEGPRADGSPAKSSEMSSSSGRRTAVIAGSTTLPECKYEIDSSAFPYLLSLAISDFIIGAFISPIQLDIYVNNKWRFTASFCDFWLALDIFFSTSSTLHTAAIAVDRWWTITRLQAMNPTQSHDIEDPTPPPSLQKTMLIFIWMLAALVSFPVIYLWQIETPGQESRQRNSEHCEPVADDTYILLSTLVSFCLPLSLTVIFYAQTAVRIRNQHKAAKFCVRQLMLPLSMARTMANQVKSLASDSVEEVGPRAVERKPALESAKKIVSSRAEIVQNLEKYLQILAHHKAMLHAMTLIVVVYCLCWTPLYTCLFVKAVCNCVTTPKEQQTWGQLITMLSWIGYANSGINPLIYFIALPEFRTLTKALIWISFENIKRAVMSTCSALKDYLFAVFCCFTVPVTWLINRHRKKPDNKHVNLRRPKLPPPSTESDVALNMEDVDSASTLTEKRKALKVNNSARLSCRSDDKKSLEISPSTEASQEMTCIISENPDPNRITTLVSLAKKSRKQSNPDHLSTWTDSPKVYRPTGISRSLSHNPLPHRVQCLGDFQSNYHDFYRAPFNKEPFIAMPVPLPPLPISNLASSPASVRFESSSRVIQGGRSHPNLASFAAQLSKYPASHQWRWAAATPQVALTDCWGRPLNTNSQEATV